MRCRVGDLAVLVNGDFQTNIGRLVTVIGCGTVGDWLIRSEGSSLFTQHTLTKRFDYRQECETWDNWLRPIRGEPETTRDETTKETVA